MEMKDSGSRRHVLKLTLDNLKSMIGQAIPFIINSDKGFTLSPEAVSFL